MALKLIPRLKLKLTESHRQIIAVILFGANTVSLLTTLSLFGISLFAFSYLKSRAKLLGKDFTFTVFIITGLNCYQIWPERETEKQRERERERDRQTDRERQRERDRQTHTHTERERERESTR